MASTSQQRADSVLRADEDDGDCSHPERSVTPQAQAAFQSHTSFRRRRFQFVVDDSDSDGDDSTNEQKHKNVVQDGTQMGNEAGADQEAEQKNAAREGDVGRRQGLSEEQSMQNTTYGADEAKPCAPSLDTVIKDESERVPRLPGATDQPQLIHHSSGQHLESEKYVEILVKAKKISEENARQLLMKAEGNVLKALSLYDEANAPISTSSPPTSAPQKPETLLERALAAMDVTSCAKIRRRHLRTGDVVIILDVSDLGTACRIRSQDAVMASSHLAPLFDNNSAQDGRADGVKYLLVLQTCGDASAMPTLQLQDLSLTVSMCDDALYTRPQLETGAKDLKTITGESPAVKQEIETRQGSVDWLKAYETLLRMISHVPLKDQLLNTKSPSKALCHVEAVAQLTAHYRATSPDSPVSTAWKLLLSGYDELYCLSPAIAAQPSRWLQVGAKLQNARVFKESMIHMIGLYPDTSVHGVPPHIAATILKRSEQLRYRRYHVDQELLLMQLDTTSEDGKVVPVSPGCDDLAYNVQCYFKEWLGEHLRYISQAGAESVAAMIFCDHESADCLQLAEFYRLLACGDDSYLPDDQVFEVMLSSGFGAGLSSKAVAKKRELDPDTKECIRKVLKTLRAKACKIVKPLTESKLRWPGSHSLQYFTSSLVDDTDLPWDVEVKEERSSDSEEPETDEDED